MSHSSAKECIEVIHKMIVTHIPRDDNTVQKNAGKKCVGRHHDIIQIKKRPKYSFVNSPVCVAGRAGTTTIFLLGSQPPQIILKFQHLARICKSIPPACVAWRAGTTTLFRLGSYFLAPQIIQKFKHLARICKRLRSPGTDYRNRFLRLQIRALVLQN